MTDSCSSKEREIKKSKIIASKKDYHLFLTADRIARGMRIDNPFVNDVWRFQKNLRRYEFYLNCRKGPLWTPVLKFLRWRHQSLSVRYGFSIPPNVFGPGLHIPHRGCIVVSPFARIGKNCRIHVGTVIGNEENVPGKGPTLGDNVYIGPGAKLYGPITIADGIAVGANSVVNSSFVEPEITIAGIPAKKVSNTGSRGLQTRAC